MIALALEVFLDRICNWQRASVVVGLESSKVEMAVDSMEAHQERKHRTEHGEEQTSRERDLLSCHNSCDQSAIRFFKVVSYV